MTSPDSEPLTLADGTQICPQSGSVLTPQQGEQEQTISVARERLFDLGMGAKAMDDYRF